MKKFILLLSIIALFCQSTFAQTGGLNFQGIARNASGAVLANQKVNLKFSILKTTETGAVEYTETKEATTNAQGIFAVVVGEVNASSFAAIDWKQAPKFLKVEMDPAGGTSFVAMGTTRLQNVPFAYYANGVNANNIDGTISVAKGGTGATDAAAARTNLGLVIGTNVQAPLTAGTDYLTPTGNAATATKLAAKKKINGVDFDGSADISITATADASTLSGTVAIAKGGTGATDAAAARTNLGLVIGTNVQAPLTAGTDYLTPTGSAASLTGFPTLNQNTTGNAATATKLSTARNINGVAFDGSANITVAADASTLSGTVSIAKGGTGLTTVGTAGQVLTTSGSGTLTWTTSGVPYSGATQAVNLGAYDLTVNGITIGSGSGKDTTNIVFGYRALSSNTIGEQNVAIGTQALESNTSGYNNIANGAYALYRNTTGNGNIALGNNALSNNISGEENIVNGNFSMQNNITGSKNIASGIASMYNNVSGDYNIANGYQALYDNRTGTFNIATGFAALASNSSGTKNIGMGYFSLLNNTISSRNIAIGDSSLLNNTSGDNVAFGHKALKSNTSGIRLTAIGNDSDVSTDGLINSTAIGNGALVSSSNTIQLGNTSISTVKTSGKITTGDVTYPNTHGTNAQVLTTTGSGTLTWTNMFPGPSGIVTVAKGGTGTSNLSGLVVGNGSNALSGLSGTVNGETLVYDNSTSSWKLTGMDRLSIGSGSGMVNQGQASVAIGSYSAHTNQGISSIALGNNSGRDNQGNFSIAIGSFAGYHNQPANSIIINSTGYILDAPANGFYVSPIRSTSLASNLLTYDPNTGEIAANSGKTFVINHPTKSENYLVHAAIEGPEAGVYYRGEAKIENNKSVVVPLPDYVSAFANNFTIQITPIYEGDEDDNLVLRTSRVKNNSFTVYGKNASFYWVVYGQRGSVEVEPKKSDVELKGDGPYKYLLKKK